MSAAPVLVVDEVKIKKAIQSGLPLTITTYTLPHEMEVYIEQILTAFLKLTAQEKIKDYIVYIVQELTGNAKKANTKRVFFMEQGLDLTDPEDYKYGMTAFKQTTLSNIAHYLQLQKQKGLYIKLILQVKKNIINIEVRNNAAVTKTELVRIHDKLDRSRQFKSLEEAMVQVLDDSEGAGLGLVIMILMLKKMGLNEDCFNITSTERETVAKIAIPLNETRVKSLSFLSSAIVDNVNSLPQFPENVIMIQRLIHDPKSEMADIARQISMDPALTADLLKTVNSAQYMLVKRLDSIPEAVKMVGIRGISNLLLSFGTQKMLGDDTQEKKVLWEHSYKTAFYAYNFIRNFRKNRDLMDDVYVCGILHDIGKIIFSAVHPELLEKIKNLCAERNFSNSVFEDLAAGMNHAEIGALIAEKWNFPEDLVTAIRYHHDPTGAPEELKDLVYAVYIANMFCEMEANNVTFDQFDPVVLDNFGINSKKQVESLIQRFSQGFYQENKK